MHNGRTTIYGPSYLWLFLLGIVLVILKLLHLADDCSWWVVLSPFYFPFALFYLYVAYVTSVSGGRNVEDKANRERNTVKTSHSGVKSGVTQKKEKTG